MGGNSIPLTRLPAARQGSCRIWSRGQGMNMHLRSQGPACYIQTTIVYQIFTGNRGVAGSGSHFDGCLLKGRDSARSCSSFGHDIPEFLFQPLLHLSSMATHTKRLPTQNDGIGAEFFGNLPRVERIKLLERSPST